MSDRQTYIVYHHPSGVALCELTADDDDTRAAMLHVPIGQPLRADLIPTSIGSVTVINNDTGAVEKDAMVVFRRKHVLEDTTMKVVVSRAPNLN